MNRQALSSWNRCPSRTQVVLAALILLASTGCRSAPIEEPPQRQADGTQLPQAVHGCWIQSEVFRDLGNPWAGKSPLPLPLTYASEVTGTHLTLRDGTRRAVIDVHIVTSETGVEVRFHLADDQETAYHVMKRATADHMIVLLRAYRTDAIKDVIPLRIAPGPDVVPVGDETRLSRTTPTITAIKREDPAL